VAVCAVVWVLVFAFAVCIACGVMPLAASIAVAAPAGFVCAVVASRTCAAVKALVDVEAVIGY